MQFTKRDVNKQYRNNTQSASGGTSGGGGVNVTVSSSGIGVDADWVLRQIKQNKVYIITTGDATGQTDSNVYSALRVDQEIQENNDRIKDELGQHFIRKDQDDSTEYALTVGGKLTGKAGVQFGETFVPGIAGGQGGKIDGQGNGELDSLIVRKFLEVPELRFNRVMVELGDKWNAPGAGIIEEVTPSSATTGTCKLKLEDGEYGAVAYGDICMGIFHSEETPSMNATADYDNGQGSFMFAGFYTCYFTITGVYSEQGKTNNGYFTYSLRPTSALWNLQYHPSVGMHFVAYGSFDDTQPTRQVSMYTTKTYTRLLKDQKTWEFTAANIAMQYGDMANMSIFGLDMTGYSMYLTNIYHKGIIRQVRDDGSVVITANDRGAYVSGTNYAYYDRVSYGGKLWLCIAENGTNTTPSESDPTWLLQVDSGTSITSAQHWQSPTAAGTKNLPYAANTIVNFADKVWISNKSTSASPYPLYLDSSGNYLTYNDGGYMIVSETQSADWDLLLDISGITDGEDGASLEVQYSTNGSSWHTTFATGDIYMRQRVGDGTWSSAIKIVGENGANGAYTNYQFAVNQSLTVAPTSGWQDAPPQVNVGYYLWMRVQKVAADGTASAWTAVRIGGEKGSKGDQGDSNVIADFTNEMDSVACTFTGAAVATTTVTTKVSLYYGTEPMTISSITATAMGSVTASVNTSTGDVIYTITKNAQLSTVQRSTITVSGTYSGQTYTRTLIFTLNGVRPGADGEAAVLYQIDTSAAVVAAYKDGTRSASTITVSKIKIVGSGREVTDEGNLTYSIDGGAETAYSTPVDVTAMQRSIVFFLRVGGVLYDQETIYLISDGSDGEGFTMMGAWKTSGCPYTKNNMVTMAGSTFIAKGTTSDPPYYVYTDSAGNRLTYNDGGYILTGDVNTSDWELLIQAPKDGADGTDTEWIYIHSTEQPSTPATSQEDDYVPSGWHDDPIGVSESMPMEWASVRMKKDGVWGSFSTPALWAKWGADGQSVSISTQSVTYQVGTSGTTAPTGTWSTSVPTVAAGRFLWTRTIVNYSDGKSTTSYSVSRAGSDGTSVTITSQSVTYAVTTTTSQPADSAFTYTSFPTVAVGRYYWVKTIVNYSDGTSTKSYSVGRVGADGTDGTPGAPGADGRTSYLHIAYATSADGSQGFSTTYFNGALYIGTYTDFTQADSTSYTSYEWARLKGEDGEGFSLAGNWTSANVPYAKGSVVAMGGSLWAAKADTSNPPLWIFTDYAGNRLTFSDGGYILTGDENSTDWMKWASDGENGKDGADGADGKDGADAIVADLDNEMDGVAVDDRGLTQSSYALTTNVWIVKGGAKITPTSVTFSGVPSGVTCTNANGQVTIAMPESTPIGDRKTVTITVAATIDGESYSRNLVFTIKGITGGVLYQLVPVYSTIKKNAAGALTPSTYLYVGVRKICNGVASDAGSGEVSVKYKINNTGSANAATYSGTKWSIPVAGVTSEIWIACYRTSDGQVFDEETVPVVTDGAKGSDGQTGRGITGVVRQFRLSTSPTSLIGSYSWSTTVPTRTTGTYIWARDVTYYDSGDPTYGTAFCTSGDTGFNGCTIRTHQNGFEIGKTYVNQTNVASVDMRYRDVVITPTTHSAASGYDVYMCKATSTTYAAGDEKNTSKWEEVSQNEASAYFTYLIAKEANINVLSGASFTIQDSNGETSIIIDSGGITQVYTSADGVDASVVGQPKMVFGGGMITYYNTNGSKAWQIGSAAQFLTSTIDSWVQKKLLFLSTNRNTAIVNIKTMTGTKVDAMQFSPGSSSAYSSYRGYTVPSGNMSQVPSSATAIPNGYYTAYATAPAQAVTEGDKVRYAVKMMRYTGGYIVSTETIEWEESL